jgi:hypothetical protein
MVEQLDNDLHDWKIGVRFRVGEEILLFVIVSRMFLNPPTLLCSGYRELLSGGKAAKGVS